MYFLSVIATLFILCFFTIGSHMEHVMYFIDIPSFILPLLICIPVLTACGLQRDFVRAFRLVSVKPQRENLHMVKRSEAAVSLVIQTLLITGGLTAVYSLIMVLRQAGRGLETGTMLASLSVSVLCLLYTFVLVLLLLPLDKKLKIMILSHSEESS